MLFISRSENESIVIGNNIEIKITSINGGAVCLGIKAPRIIGVHRKEVADHITSIMKHSNISKSHKTASSTEIVKK